VFCGFPKREGPVPGYQFPQRKLSQADDTFMLLCIVQLWEFELHCTVHPCIRPHWLPNPSH